jgi:hypothetical protein
VPSPKIGSPVLARFLQQREDQFLLAQAVGAFDLRPAAISISCRDDAGP